MASKTEVKKEGKTSAKSFERENAQETAKEMIVEDRKLGDEKKYQKVMAKHRGEKYKRR